MVSKPVLFSHVLPLVKKKKTKKENQNEKGERYLNKRRGGTLSVSQAALLLKTNGVFAKIEPKLYIFNLLRQPGIKTEDTGDTRQERRI